LKRAPKEEGETLQRMGFAGKGNLQGCLEKTCEYGNKRKGNIKVEDRQAI